MIHIIIRTEKRKPQQTPMGESRARLALPVNNDLFTPTGKTISGPFGEQPEIAVTPQPPQLHTQGVIINDPSNIEYAAEWDGKTPWITVLVGSISDIKMAYAGWPMVTKEEWDALHPAVPLPT